ncbi:hypothetical protein FH972_010406 [Carpinus fangiana]|uniref:Uncharacterized protein n=1 Tax=Carpinus fangiana TaxID=176857 RepID=A0A660KQ43_9ROSI|nr:hypothetical protein FH972_010406 [Carpinus fangiana]
MELTTPAFNESTNIPFIVNRRESFVAVGCHLALAHCLVQFAYSSKQPATNLNSTNDHDLLTATRQPCRPSCNTPCLHKYPANFLPLDHVLQAWHSTILSTVAGNHLSGGMGNAPHKATATFKVLAFQVNAADCSAIIELWHINSFS